MTQYAVFGFDIAINSPACVPFYGHNSYSSHENIIREKQEKLITMTESATIQGDLQQIIHLLDDQYTMASNINGFLSKETKNDFSPIVQPPPKRVMASIKISLPLNSLKRRLPKPVILLNSEGN